MLFHTHKSGVSKLVPANCLLRLRPPMAQTIHWRHWRVNPSAPRSFMADWSLILDKTELTCVQTFLAGSNGPGEWGDMGKRGPLKMHAREKSPVFLMFICISVLISVQMKQSTGVSSLIADRPPTRLELRTKLWSCTLFKTSWNPDLGWDFPRVYPPLYPPLYSKPSR